MKLIYIQSLSRSGSTFLQQVLAAQSGCVSLGEVHRVLTNSSMKREDPYDDARRSIGNPHTHDKSPCSCGASKEECAFWGPVIKSITGRPLKECYTELTKIFQEQYPGHTLVDSSKLARGYQENYVANGLIEPADVRVILLIRDYRAWCHSMRKRNKIRYASGHYPPGYFSYVADAYRWLFNNRNATHELLQSNIPCCIVSYERLVFDFESEIKRILLFLSRDPESFELESLPNMHELFGSQSMKTTDDGAKRRIAPSYDPTWLSDSSSIYYGPILFPVAKFNHYVHEKLSKAA